MIHKALFVNPSLNLTALCRFAQVSRSGYYAFLKSRPKKLLRDKLALKLIGSKFEKSFRKAGIRTIEMMLRRDGLIFNHKKIARIKKQYGLVTRIRRPNPCKGINFTAREHVQIPNILKRDFISLTPDTAYSTDMTYLLYGNCQRAFLSATKDLATNEIVSYQLMRTPSVSYFVNEFKCMITRLPKDKRKNLIIHSDQGYQYTHPHFISLLKDAGITQSMSRRGRCLDNAPIESFFGHFKDHADIKKCRSFEEVQEEVDRVMKYYNYDRPQIGLNRKPPAEYRGLIRCLF